MAKIEEKGKEFEQVLRSSEELKQVLHKLLEDPEKYAEKAMILATRETVDRFKEIIRSRSKDRSEKIKEMEEIIDAFKELYHACKPYLSDEAKKEIIETLEKALRQKLA